MKSSYHKKNKVVILNAAKDLLHQRFSASLGMTVITAIGIAFILITLSISVRAQDLSQQPCYSDRGGYCMKIVAPKAHVNNTEKNTNAGFAALRVVPDSIPGLEFLGNYTNLGDLLASLYYFLLGLVGISALAMFVWGGIEYMLAGDKDPSKARERMKNAVYGLALALTSWLILYTINPDLTARLDINLDPITPQQHTDDVNPH